MQTICKTLVSHLEGLLSMFLEKSNPNLLSISLPSEIPTLEHSYFPTPKKQGPFNGSHVQLNPLPLSICAAVCVRTPTEVDSIRCSFSMKQLLSNMCFTLILNLILFSKPFLHLSILFTVPTVLSLDRHGHCGIRQSGFPF